MGGKRLGALPCPFTRRFQGVQPPESVTVSLPFSSPPLLGSCVLAIMPENSWIACLSQ